MTDSPLVEAKPLQPASQRQVSLQKLLDKAVNHTINTDEAAALSARLAALNGQITEAERAELAGAGGRSLHQIARGLAEATDEDAQEQARVAGARRRSTLWWSRPWRRRPIQSSAPGSSVSSASTICRSMSTPRTC